MNGIFAAWHKQDPSRAGLTLARITDATRSEREPIQSNIDNGIALAVLPQFRTQQISRTPHFTVVCDADLSNGAELWQACGREVNTAAPPPAACVIAAAYERFGCGFAERLEGAFSTIIWDRLQNKLVAAIDRFGIKRLVYYDDDHVVLIASRIDTLKRSGHIETEVNPRAIVNVLNFTTSLAPETALKNVWRLAPGTLLQVTKTERRTQTYWDMRYGIIGTRDEDRLAEELASVVERAVAARCKDTSVGEAGAFLSGGTDSSTVVGMMDRCGPAPVKAFSIGFREHAFNELEYAVITARKFRALHHTYLVGPDDCLAALPKMVEAFDEPFANSSAIPTYFCARLAAQSGVKVLLAGDGGDELFGGNERYLTDRIFGLYQEAPRFIRKGFVEPALALLPGNVGLVKRARSYVRRSNTPTLDRYFSYHFLRAHEIADVFEPDFLAALGDDSVLEVPERYYREAPATDHLDRLLYVDVKITLGDSDLPKVTMMSELAGIQTRFPFLDRGVAEFSGTIPARLKVKGFQKRYLFKRAFRNLLPAEVLRKKKHGFGIPVSNWLKTDRRLHELCRDTLFSSRAFERGYFRRQFIEDLFRMYEADESTYYGDTVWTFLVLELWHRQFVDEPARALA